MALDPLVLVDALAIIMGHEEKELCKPGHLALMLMVGTATTLLGSKEMVRGQHAPLKKSWFFFIDFFFFSSQACRLPLIEYLSERMCALCYERAWYAKLGGCIAIKFMFERCALKWVYEHMFTFLKALLFVMMDLTGEVSFCLYGQDHVRGDFLLQFFSHLAFCKDTFPSFDGFMFFSS